MLVDVLRVSLLSPDSSDCSAVGAKAWNKKKGRREMARSMTSGGRIKAAMQSQRHNATSNNLLLKATVAD